MKIVGLVQPLVVVTPNNVAAGPSYIELQPVLAELCQ
jgi:hypothetical protein